MLTHLRIRRQALVDDESASFHAGRNVVTGETSAREPLHVEALPILRAGEPAGLSLALRAGSGGVGAILEAGGEGAAQ